jgi:hypothetical protein
MAVAVASNEQGAFRNPKQDKLEAKGIAEINESGVITALSTREGIQRGRAAHRAVAPGFPKTATDTSVSLYQGRALFHHTPWPHSCHHTMVSDFGTDGGEVRQHPELR